jgi:hypothetical protein
MSAVVPAGGGGFGVIVRRKPCVPLASRKYPTI